MTKIQDRESDVDAEDDSCFGGREVPSVDPDAIARAIDEGMPNWAEFAEMRAEVRACKADRVRRLARRNWVRGIVGGGIGTLIAGAVFVIRALIAAGTSAEAGRVQAEQVRDTTARVRELELAVARVSGQLFPAHAGRSLPDQE